MNPCCLAPYAVEVTLNDGRVVQGCCTRPPGVPCATIPLAWGGVVHIPLVNLGGEKKTVQSTSNFPPGVKAVPSIRINKELVPKGKEHFITRVINFIEHPCSSENQAVYSQFIYNQLVKIRIDLTRFIEERRQLYNSPEAQSFFNQVTAMIKCSCEEQSMSMIRMYEWTTTFSKTFRTCLTKYPTAIYPSTSS